MQSNNIVSIVIDHVIKIITYEDGSQHFEIIEQSNKDNNQHIINDNRSWWQKLKDWWNDSSITPYVKRRNLADPFGDQQEEYGNKTAWEAGIKIKF